MNLGYSDALEASQCGKASTEWLIWPEPFYVQCFPRQPRRAAGEPSVALPKPLDPSLSVSAKAYCWLFQSSASNTVPSITITSHAGMTQVLLSALTRSQEEHQAFPVCKHI